MSATEATQWHYLVGSNQRGPFAPEQMAALVRNGTVRPDTMVWSAGMSGWVAFAQSPLARELGTTAPPGVPPPPPPTMGQGGGQGGGQGAGQVFGQGASQGSAFLAAMAAGPPGGFSWAVATCLLKYATFQGRAGRPEFWFFLLFGVLGALVTSFVDITLFGLGGVRPLNTIFSLGMTVPFWASGARRLHDTDRSGWWQLLWLVPVIGWIVAVVFLCQRGTVGANRFG